MPRFYQFSIIYQHTANNDPTYCQCRTNFGLRCCQFVLMTIKPAYYQTPPNASYYQHLFNVMSTCCQHLGKIMPTPIYIQDIANIYVPKAIFILNQIEKYNIISDYEYHLSVFWYGLARIFLHTKRSSDYYVLFVNCHLQSLLSFEKIKSKKCYVQKYTNIWPEPCV